MTTSQKNPSGVRHRDMPHSVICLCTTPVVFGAHCTRCHHPLLEKMSINYNKAMTLAAMHEGVVPPQRMEAVLARYRAARR